MCQEQQNFKGFQQKLFQFYILQEIINRKHLLDVMLLGLSHYLHVTCWHPYKVAPSRAGDMTHTQLMQHKLSQNIQQDAIDIVIGEVFNVKTIYIPILSCLLLPLPQQCGKIKLCVSTDIRENCQIPLKIVLHNIQFYCGTLAHYESYKINIQVFLC